MRLRGCGVGLLLVLAGLGGPDGAAQVSPGAGLDHIILETGSLVKGSAAFARLTGVTPAAGGQHPGRGTQNALVALGGGRYLEILAPLVDSGAVEPLRPVGWAVHSPDLVALRERLRTAGLSLSESRPGSRRRPDGGLLTWSTAGLLGDDAPSLPFFIQWGREVAHPSTTSPSGCTLVTFQVATPDSTRLGRLVRALELPVVVRAAPHEEMTLTLRCPRGEVRFTS